MARTAERHLVLGRLCKVFHSLLCQVLPAIDTPRGVPLRLHPDCPHEALRANIAETPTQLRAQVGYSLFLIRLFRFGRTTRSGGAVASKRLRRPSTASSRLRPLEMHFPHLGGRQPQDFFVGASKETLPFHHSKLSVASKQEQCVPCALCQGRIPEMLNRIR